MMINNLYQVMVKTFRLNNIRNLRNKNNKNQMMLKKIMMSSHNKLKIKFKMSIKMYMRFKKLINNLKMMINNLYQVIIRPISLNNNMNMRNKKWIN